MLKIQTGLKTIAAVLYCTAAVLMLQFVAPFAARADWSSSAGTQDHNNIFSASEAQAHARGNINGTIASVDYSGNTIVVSSLDGRQTITILPTTSIFRDGTNAGISDLSPGQHVTVSVSSINGALVAQIIRIH